MILFYLCMLYVPTYIYIFCYCAELFSIIFLISFFQLIELFPPPTATSLHSHTLCWTFLIAEIVVRLHICAVLHMHTAYVEETSHVSIFLFDLAGTLPPGVRQKTLEHSFRVPSAKKLYTQVQWKRNTLTIIIIRWKKASQYQSEMGKEKWSSRRPSYSYLCLLEFEMKSNEKEILNLMRWNNSLKLISFHFELNNLIKLISNVFHIKLYTPNDLNIDFKLRHHSWDIGWVIKNDFPLTTMPGSQRIGDGMAASGVGEVSFEGRTLLFLR